MVRWIKIAGSQYLGFWVLGLAAFALQEAPYLIMPFLRLESNPIMNLPESSAVLNICEKLLGSLCVVLLTFVVQKDAGLFAIGSGWQRIGFFAAVAALLLNYVGWLLYFHGRQSAAVILFFIVVLPPLYYAFIGIWRENWPLFLTGIVFAIVHTAHVSGNLRT